MRILPGLPLIETDTLRLDGGGIRGISGLLIVLEIMSRIAYDLGVRTGLRPRDYFEMTGGSGTGAYVVP